MNIEPLETRIAPAAVIKFSDIDGDAVTITISKGTLAELTTTYDASPDGAVGSQLRGINLNGDADFNGANITVVAKPQPFSGVLLGDGHVDIGFIDATGLTLGTVTIPGDLGKLVAGQAAQLSVKSLTVDSLGARGTDTGAPDIRTVITGNLGTAKIRGDVRGYLSATGDIASVTVGGSMLGGGSGDSGSIYAAGNLRSVTVRGDVAGGVASGGGSIGSGLELGNVTIGGSLLGAIGGPFGSLNGRIFSGKVAPSDMGIIKIGHDVAGGTSNGNKTGTISSTGDIVSVTIGGDLGGNHGFDSGRIDATGNVGSIVIRGSVLAQESNGKAGAITVGGTLKTAKIGGSVVGGIDDYSGRIEAGTLGSLTIGGDLTGDAGNYSGAISVGDGGLGTITILGSVRGGFDPNSSSSLPQGTNTGVIESTGKAGKIAIGGSLVGSVPERTGQILLNGNLDSLAIGGDVLGNDGFISGIISSGGKIGSITIRGSMLGGPGDGTGKIEGDLGIAKIAIGGSVVGGNFGAGESGMIRSKSGLLGSIVIGGDLAASTSQVDSIVYSGLILGEHIGNVTIGGSIIGAATGGTVTAGGAIISEREIGNIVVKGSLVGTAQHLVTIYARGLEGNPVAKNIAIKSLTVGGKVENAWIFGGVNTDGAGVAGNAQIGAVKVAGDWIASSLASGATSSNGTIGDGNDATIAGATGGKIASIIIGGTVLGRAGTNETFGFFAHEVGSFKYQGIVVPLIKGAGNDAFFVGLPSKAQPVGPSLSPSTFLKPDAFAVHVYEV